jgi:hypothetical protein
MPRYIKKAIYCTEESKDDWKSNPLVDRRSENPSIVYWLAYRFLNKYGLREFTQVVATRYGRKETWEMIEDLYNSNNRTLSYLLHKVACDSIKHASSVGIEMDDQIEYWIEKYFSDCLRRKKIFIAESFLDSWKEEEIFIADKWYEYLCHDGVLEEKRKLTKDGRKMRVFRFKEEGIELIKEYGKEVENDFPLYRSCVHENKFL